MWEQYDVNLSYLFETSLPQRSRMEELAHYSYGFILEVGAHDGMISWLCKGQGKDVLTSDISRASCRKAHNRSLDVVVCDVRFLPFQDSKFDTVICGELLEHLPNMGYGLVETQRVSKKRIIISLPHKFWNGDPTHLWEIKWRGITFQAEKLEIEDKLHFTILIMDKK